MDVRIITTTAAIAKRAMSGSIEDDGICGAIGATEAAFATPRASPDVIRDHTDEGTPWTTSHASGAWKRYTPYEIRPNPTNGCQDRARAASEVGCTKTVPMRAAVA